MGFSIVSLSNLMHIVMVLIKQLNSCIKMYYSEKDIN